MQAQKFQDEEISHSIRICESLLDETPFVAAINFFVKFNFSCFHADTPQQYILTSIVEKNLPFHSVILQ